MKIALVNKFYPPVIGGIEYHVRLLAENLEKYTKVEKIDILVANNNAVFSNEQLTEKIYITRLPNWKTIASTPIAPSFYKYFKKIDADIFHFHFPYPVADFFWLLSQEKRPFVITYHADILRQKTLNKFYAPIRKRFFAKAERIFATSPNLIESSKVLKEFESKIDVIPLGIDPSIYLSEQAIMHGNRIKNKFKRRKIILFVGRLVYYKGVEVLVEAFRDIDAELIMIGKGDLEHSLRNMVRDYSIEEKVHFYSDITDEELAGYFNACDIFILPSIANTEAYGLVQLEAQACGKPVISTNLPTGVPYVNKHEETGLVVEPGNVVELNRAIKKLLDDNQLCIILGENARHRMLKEFTDSEMTKKVFDVYSEILKPKNK